MPLVIICNLIVLIGCELFFCQEGAFFRWFIESIVSSDFNCLFFDSKFIGYGRYSK